MLVKEYLKQGRLLDQRINCNLRRLQGMRNNICNISAPTLTADKVQNSNDGDAPFVKALLQIEEMQDRINREIDQLVELKKQIDEVIHSVNSERHQLVLIYRYLEGRTWEEIGTYMYAGNTTVRRWHREALKMVQMPEEPIFIKSML